MQRQCPDMTCLLTKGGSVTEGEHMASEVHTSWVTERRDIRLDLSGRRCSRGTVHRWQWLTTTVASAGDGGAGPGVVDELQNVDPKQCKGDWWAVAADWRLASWHVQELRQ
jgi:hypothetical protein